MNKIGLCLVGFLIAQLLVFSQAAVAQRVEKTRLAENEVAGPTSAANVTTNETPDVDTYQIGPGDILEIRVFNRPQLSREAVRVDARGMIRVPLIEEGIRAACRTETELAKELGKRYLEYLRNPSIEVFVKEFQSQPVAVLGAVVTPGRFQLQRRVRLLELLSYAGGPGERAGARIQIIHTSDLELCQDVATDTELTGDSQTDLGSLVSYNLNDTLRGEEQANPYVRPGDIVTLPESEKAFVVGNVFRPATIPLKESITVSQAIAMAGGIMPDTKSEKVRIIRQMAGSTTRTEIFVDLKGIDKRRAEDIVLQPNDIVDVPMSGGKKFLRTLVSAIAPAISNTPIRVIR